MVWMASPCPYPFTTHGMTLKQSGVAPFHLAMCRWLISCSWVFLDMSASHGLGKSCWLFSALKTWVLGSFCWRVQGPVTGSCGGIRDGPLCRWWYLLYNGWYDLRYSVARFGSLVHRVATPRFRSTPAALKTFQNWICGDRESNLVTLQLPCTPQ